MEQIEQAIFDLEVQHDIDVLFVVDGGSRTWGWASAESDYDVRFVFKRKTMTYLQLDTPPDMIQVSQGNLDMVGWDLPKALHLIRRTNPSAIEWLLTPVVYQEDVTRIYLRSVVERLFMPGRIYWHYISLAKGNFGKYLQADDPSVKRYLVVIAAILKADYLIQQSRLPPVDLPSLLQHADLPVEVAAGIEILLEAKRHSHDVAPAILTVVHQWIEQRLEHQEQHAFPREDTEEITRLLNSLLHDLVLNA